MTSTINTETHDLRQQDQRADWRVIAPLPLFTLLPHLLHHVVLFVPLQKPHCWWNQPARSLLTSLRSTDISIQTNSKNKPRAKEGSIRALIIHEIDILQHAKFTPKWGLLLHFISLLSWAKVVTLCQLKKTLSHGQIKRKTHRTLTHNQRTVSEIYLATLYFSIYQCYKHYLMKWLMMPCNVVGSRYTCFILVYPVGTFEWREGAWS